MARERGRVTVAEVGKARLTKVVALDAQARTDHLEDWAFAPSARFCHPREEHLLPLMVAAGAADRPGRRIYAESLLNIADRSERQ